MVIGTEKVIQNQLKQGGAKNKTRKFSSKGNRNRLVKKKSIKKSKKISEPHVSQFFHLELIYILFYLLHSPSTK